MKPEEILKILQDYNQSEDTDEELSHVDADAMLCDLLLQHGYSEIVKEFMKLHKWYA